MSIKKNPLNPTLLALYSAAFALPAYNKPVGAETPDDAPSVSIRYSRYNEDRISDNNFIDSGSGVGFGEQERMDIDAGQVNVIYPINDELQLTVNGAYEDLSGASPWFILPDSASGDPVQALSGATIDDQRLDVSTKLDIFKDKYTISPILGISVENDYRSISGGVSVARELDNQATTIRGGVSASFDEIRPTRDLVTDPGRINRDEKESYSVFIGIGQVINKNTVVQSTFTVSEDDGFLSDPYKLVSVGGILERDNRPEDRTKISWSAQLRRWSETFGAALHADYRFYYDDWDIHAHTLELGIIKPTSTGWTIESSVRYYSQTQAEFYEPFFASAPSNGFVSSDYRLSPYGSLNYRVKLSKQFGNWVANATAERYESDANLSFQKVDTENPGLIDFSLLSFGLDYKFE